MSHLKIAMKYMYLQQWSYFSVHKSIFISSFASGYVIDMREQILENILKGYKQRQVDTDALW